MDSNPHLRRIAVHAAMVGESTLNGDRAVDGIRGRLEDDEEPVPCMVDLLSAVLLEASPQLSVEPRAQVMPGGIADRLHQVRRARQVGEHERLALRARSTVRDQRCLQLLARTDLELVVHMPKVVLDGLWAQVEPAGSLARGRPLRQG